MSMKASQNLKKSADDLIRAARHSKKASKAEKKGNIVKAGKQANLAKAATQIAERYAAEAARDDAEDLREDQGE